MEVSLGGRRGREIADAFHPSSPPLQLVLVLLVSTLNLGPRTGTVPVDAVYSLAQYKNVSSLQQCCMDQMVSGACLGFLCGPTEFDPNFQHSINNNHASCFVDVDKLLFCLSAWSRTTTSPMCEHVNCRGMKLNKLTVDGLLEDQWNCVEELPLISACFDDDFAQVPRPPSRVKLESVTSSTAELSWYSPAASVNTVGSYGVVYRRKQAGLRSEQVLTTNRSITLDSLTPGTLYEVRISSVSNRGTSWPSAAVIFMTYPATDKNGTPALQLSSSTTTIPYPARGPHHLSIVEVTTHSLSMSWRPPEVVSKGDRVLEYQIRYRRTHVLPSENWTNVTVATSQTTHILQNLQPDTKYEVRVFAVTSHSVESSVSTIDAWTLPPKSPEVKLEARKDFTSCCLTQNVSSRCSPVCSGSGIVNLHSCSRDLLNIINCAADGADRETCCSRRNVPDHCIGFCSGSAHILELNHFMCFAFAEQIFSCFRETDGELPWPPDDFVLVDVGSTSATFAWRMTNHSENELTYRLHYTTVTSSGDEGPDVFFENVHSPYILRDLSPSSEYNVYVVAVNGHGASSPSTAVSFYTHPGDAGSSVYIVQSPPGFIPVGSPVNLECVHASTDGMEPEQVYWVRGDEKVREGIHYEIAASEPRHGGRFTCVVDYGSGHSLSADVVLRIQHELTVTPLEEKVSVAVGQTAHLVCRFTGSPEFFEWSVYDEFLGESIPLRDARYSLTQYVLDDVAAVDCQLSIDDVQQEDYGVYQCEGSNAYSDSTTAYVHLTGTDELRARVVTISEDALTGRNIPGLPTSVNMSLTSAGYVLVQWNEPQFKPEAVQFYELAFIPTHGQSDSIILRTAAESRTLVVSAVDAFTVYFVSIAAGNENGSSKPVHLGSIMTYEFAPSAPRHVTTELMDGISVTVTWKIPEKHHWAVEGYRVYYSPTIVAIDESRGLQTTLMAETQNTTLTVNSLEQLTEYVFYVTAKSEHYESQPSNSSYILTKCFVCTAVGYEKHDASQPEVSPASDYHRKVALAVGLAILCVSAILTATVLRYYYTRKWTNKARCQLSNSVSFENPNYSSLVEAQVRFPDAYSDDAASKPLCTTSAVSGLRTNHNNRNSRHLHKNLNSTLDDDSNCFS